MNQYDSIASYYEKLMGDVGDLPNHHLLNPIFFDLLPQQKKLNVLDIGCGSGRWTKALASKYVHVTGFDKSEEMLGIAKEKRSAKNITYKYADLEDKLPFSSNMFNLLFANMVVHYVTDIQNAANELYRVAKPKSALLFSTHHPKFDLARYEFLANVTKRTEFKTKDSLKGKVGLTRFYEPFKIFIKHFIDAGFTLEAQKDAIITADFVEIYPRYENYVGLPRFTVFKFNK